MDYLNPIHEGNREAGKIMGPIWDEFSPPAIRKEHHAFLMHILKQAQSTKGEMHIFETCLGSGLDVIPLAKAGFHLVANEFDEHYRKRAEECLVKAGIQMEIVEYDWLQLGAYHPSQLFDAVLCVGNSICYIFGHDAQMKAIRNFENLIAQNGLLIIDERNFQFMLDHRNDIHENKNAVVSSHNGLNKHVLYGSEKYFPYPVHISDDMIVMGLWRQGESQPISHFYFYPFKRGELLGMLQTVFGSENVVMYSDYQSGDHNDAGFYQYVCRKN